MKKLLFYVLFLLPLLGLCAGAVTGERAANIGSDLFSYLSGTDTPCSDIEAYSSPGNQAVDFYILRFEPKGFMILAAVEQAAPMLAYSLESAFPRDNMPAHVQWYLRQYSLSMAELRNHPEWAVDPGWGTLARRDFTAYHINRDVSPLLSTNWDQDWPYNSMCPVDAGGPGGRVYAGCVATAMGQVMKKWNYPTTGVGSHTYTATGYGSQTANFGATTYNWASMPNSITSVNTNISTLLYHLGVSVNMIYAPDGSGAYSSDVRTSLVNYFRYNSAAQYKTASSYTASAWATMIRADLDLGRPVYYSGQGAAGGHAFVLDGYQGTDFFHFNWGWSGYYNGYYYLNNLNPGSNTFNLNQAAVFSVYPLSTETANPPTNATAVVYGNNMSVNINWQAPGGTQQGFTDGFESYADFAVNFAPWTLVDVDLSTTYGFTGTTFPNSGSAMAYLVFNPGATVPPITTITAHAGAKMAACFAATIPPNNDWLITPQVSVGAGGQISFWAKSHTAQYGLERFKVGVSTSGTTPNSFTIISGASYISAPVEWTNYTYSLAAYTGQQVYIGIQCLSYDAFIFFVDDVVVQVASSNAPLSTQCMAVRNDTRPVLGYKVWRLLQGQENNEATWTALTPSFISTLSFVDTGWSTLPIATYKWAVKAGYTGGVLSTPAFSNTIIQPGQGTTQTIALASGWNLVSLNVSPANHTIASLFAGLSGNVQQIKGIEGVYIPNNPFSTLSSLTDGKAYSILMTSAANWSVTGTPITVTLPLALVDGWNMVAYLPQSALPLATALQSIASWLQQVKGTDGVYIPNNPFSTLTTMSPNKGYWILLSGAHNLVYPTGGKHATSESNLDMPVAVLPASMAVFAKCSGAEAGDILLAKVGSVLRGAERFRTYEGITAVLIQIYTETAGEEVAFSIMKPDKTELQLQTTVSSQPQETIGTYPNYLPLELKGDNPIPTLTCLIGCYPNPFNPSTTISFSVAADNSQVTIEIFNIRGQRISTLLNTRLSQGNHSIVWCGKDDMNHSVASGIYFVKMQSESYQSNTKIMLSK